MASVQLMGHLPLYDVCLYNVGVSDYVLEEWIILPLSIGASQSGSMANRKERCFLYNITKIADR